MSKLLVGFVAFSVLILGFLSFADAKTFETDVPFDYQNSGCTLIVDTPDFKQYDCSAEWKSENYKEPGEEYSPAEDGCASGFDIDIRTGECKPHEQIKEEAQKACEVDPECPAGHYDPKPDPDPRLPKGDNPNATDKELIKKINALLENPAECYQGIGTTAGIQEIRSFEIPVVEVNGRLVLDTSVPHNSVDLKGYLGDIIKNARECHAEQTLLNPQGGILSSASAIKGYCDALPKTSNEYHPLCGYSVRDHSMIASDVPIWTQEMAGQKANIGVEHDTFDIVEDVCEGYYTETYKMTFKECRDIADAKIEKSGGTPPDMKDYGSDIEEKVNNFKEDGGKRMAQELAAKAIQDRISELFRQIKALESQK